MWSQGDYPAVAKLLEPCAIKLADACNLRAGMTVLDVAAGTGNFALAASERGADVTACDLTSRMIDLGRERSHAAGHDIEWREADAEALPFPDANFDVVASVFGAMFAPRPERVSSELFRVCRDDGLVAMANYSWDGFLGEMSKLFARYSNRLPLDLPSPFEWGDPEVVSDRFAGLAKGVDVEESVLTMSFESVGAGFEFWERTNAPTIALRATSTPERYVEFQRDARGLMEELNESGSGRLELSSSYITVLARK